MKWGGYSHYQVVTGKTISIGSLIVMHIFILTKKKEIAMEIIDDLEQLHYHHYGKPIGSCVASYPSTKVKQKTAPKIIDRIIKEFNPESVLDIGSGTGVYVEEFLKRNVKAIGIEGNLAVKPILVTGVNNIVFKDLRSPLNLEERYDLVWSIEVVEHIDEKYIDVLIYNLTKYCDKWLVMTSGLNSYGRNPEHLNEQDGNYWIKLIEKEGFTYCDEISQEIMDYNKKILKRKGLDWFKECLLVFKKQ